MAASLSGRRNWRPTASSSWRTSRKLDGWKRAFRSSELCAHCCPRDSPRTPVCFTPHISTITKSSRCGGQQWRSGRGAPSIPSCSSNALPTWVKLGTETLRGATLRRKGPYRKENAGSCSTCSEASPQRPNGAIWAFGAGYGYLAQGLYKESSRVRAPGREYLLFRGPIEGVLTFLEGEHPFWGDTPNIWWPADRAWCVATDIDLYDTYVGGSGECIEAIMGHSELEALPATLDARLDIGADIINAPKP